MYMALCSRHPCVGLNFCGYHLIVWDWLLVLAKFEASLLLESSAILEM
jgi:hypothetical protein